MCKIMEIRKLISKSGFNVSVNAFNERHRSNEENHRSAQ